MPTYNFSGYDEDDVVWAGGTPTNGDTITFGINTNHTVSITDNDSSLQDGTDDRDDEDGDQTAVVLDEFGNTETTGQVQPRERITLTDGTNTYVMHRVFIASAGKSYYIFEDPAPPRDTELTVTGVSTPNSTSYSSFSTTGVVCFTPGTMIATPNGRRPVEALSAGDVVLTVDAGPQPIRYICTRTVQFEQAKSGLKPIHIRAGALGHGIPARDLAVSPQHRLLFKGDTVQDAFGTRQVLGMAKGLTALPGIRVMSGKKEVTYISLLLPQHHVIDANGAYAETLWPGPQAIEALASADRKAIYALCPGLLADPVHGYGAPARRMLTRRQTEHLAQLLRAEHTHAAPPFEIPLHVGTTARQRAQAAW